MQPRPHLLLSATTRCLPPKASIRTPKASIQLRQRRRLPPVWQRKRPRLAPVKHKEERASVTPGRQKQLIFRSKIKAHIHHASRRTSHCNGGKCRPSSKGSRLGVSERLFRPLQDTARESRHKKPSLISRDLQPLPPSPPTNSLTHAFGSQVKPTNLRISYFRRCRVQPRDINASLRNTSVPGRRAGAWKGLTGSNTSYVCICIVHRRQQQTSASQVRIASSPKTCERAFEATNTNKPPDETAETVVTAGQARARGGRGGKGRRGGRGSGGTGALLNPFARDSELCSPPLSERHRHRLQTRGRNPSHHRNSPLRRAQQRDSGPCALSPPRGDRPGRPSC